MTLVLLWLRKNWLSVALIVGLVVAVLVVGGLVARWQAEKRAVAAAHAKAGVFVAEGSERASAAATEAVAGLGERDATRTQTAQENRDDILSAPDAKASAGATGDAGLAGMCRRASYRDHPRCAGLRGPHPAPGSR